MEGSKCGAGGIIKISEAEEYKWTFNCGNGSNTKAELLSAWVTFTLANKLTITYIQVLGDSKVVLDWLLNTSRLKVAALEGWKIRIKELTSTFRAIKYQHIYREYNVAANNQSKLALEVSEGFIHYHHWISGVEGPRMQFRVH
jgi:ribonuclease HI